MLSTVSLVLVLILVPLAFAATETDISKLRKDLLRGYDKNSRPVHNHENATTIALYFYLEGFDWDEENSLFTAQSFILFKWHDEHLTWDPDSYGDLKEVHFADDEIWKPDLMAYNNVDKSELDPFIKVQLAVEQPNASTPSTVYWFPSAKFEVGCIANLRAWPYDEQECFVVLGSWTQDGNDINLIMAEGEILIDQKTYHPNREWDLTEKWIERRLTEYLPEDRYVDLLFTFRLKRKSATHATCILMPGLVIIVATLVCFWLPPGSRERTSILLLSMFINILYLHNVHKMIPNNGDSVPLVVCFFRDSLVMVGFSLLFTVGLRYLANLKREEPVPLPSVITRFVEGLPGKIVCLEQRPNIARKQEAGDTESANQVEGSQKKISFREDWAWLAHCLDRVLFLVYLLLYLCMYFALL